MSAPTTHSPLVVNTADGTCWTRRVVTSGGLALYAPEAIRTGSEFVMATLPELAEHGIVGSAFALPMPVAPEPEPEDGPELFRLVGVVTADDYDEAVYAAEQAESGMEGQGYKGSVWVQDDDGEAEKLRARVVELETLLRQATEFRLWEPGYGLYIRRAPGAAGFGVLEARRTDKGRRCWTTSGWQYSAVLTDTELFCWPDAQTAVAEARRVMPGAGVCETVPFKAQPLTVFRASHDSIVMGLYTTREAAQAHCEAKVTQEETAGSVLHLSWSADDIGPDAEYELHITPAETGGLIRGTGYVVTPLEVAAEFDPDGDE